MKIQLHNLYAKVVEATEEERLWLAQYLSFEDASSRYKTGNRGKPTKMRLFNRYHNTFPSGLYGLVRRGALRKDWPLELDDQRLVTSKVDPNADLGWLRWYQSSAVEALIDETRGIIQAPTGSGKCLGRGTQILRFDGQQIAVEDIKEGMQLMGPDSRPRTVQSVTQGTGPLYRIVPKKGEPWICNDVHVLTLVHTETGEVEDIALDEYLKKSAYWKHCRKLFQPEAIEYASEHQRALELDPYFLGVWLGDGRKKLSGVEISKPDAEIELVCREVAATFGATVKVDTYKSCPTYRITTPRGEPNSLLVTLQGLMKNGVRIPHKYKVAGRQHRLELLAGLLDTDGHQAGGYYEITQKNKDLAEDIAQVARSLGFRVTAREKIVDGSAYQRLNIIGDGTGIPLRIRRKVAKPRRQKKNPLRTGFDVEAVGNGEYFGFTLDGDGRFLLGDFTVTHNTEVLVGLTRAVPGLWLCLAHRTTLVTQAAERFEKRTGSPAYIYGSSPILSQAKDQSFAALLAAEFGEGCRLVVATFQTFYQGLQRGDHQVEKILREAEGLVVDEAHTLPADSFYRVAMATPNAYWRVGLSATPLARGDRRSVKAVAALGPVIYRIKTQTLIDGGVLAKPDIRMVPVEQYSTKPTYQGIYGELVVRSTLRHKAVVEAVRVAAKPCIVFVKQLNHGNELKKRLLKEGLNVDFVSGKEPEVKRQRMKEKLERGDTDVLVASVVFQEGVDIPSLESVVMAHGGRSIISTLQRIGRGMRTDQGRKKSFEVWDIYDCGCSMLEKHSKTRRRAYEREGFEVDLLENVYRKGTFAKDSNA